MIAKINTSSSSRGALNYNYEKLQAGEAKILQTNKIWHKHATEEFTANELAYIFEERAAVNKNTRNPFVHISLNPSPDDVLTDEQLVKIAEEYMQEMGFGDQPYIMFKHEDIDRHHLHIVTTNVDSQGRKIKIGDESIDKNDFYRSKRITQALEQKYKLHPAVKQEDGNSPTWQPEKVDTAKKIAPQLRNIVKHLTRAYKFQSLSEYRALLSLYNIDVQEVKGEAAGRLYAGLIYSVVDDTENRMVNPVKSSVLGKFAGAENLGKIYKKSAANPLSEAAINRIKTDLLSVMHAATNEVNLIRLAKEKDIDLRLYKSVDGRIYGVTIVDHKSRSVFKASRLGKEFSANAFHSLLNQSSSKQHPLQERQAPPLEHDKHSLSYAKDFGWMPEQVQADEQAPPSAAFPLGGMGSLFNAVGGATKYAPKKRKKKKEKGQDLSI